MQGGVVNYLCLPHNPSTTGITMAISTQDMLNMGSAPTAAILSDEIFIITRCLALSALSSHVAQCWWCPHGMTVHLDGPRSIMGTWWPRITATGTKKTSSVLTKTQSMFRGLMGTRMVPCYTSCKGAVAHFRALHMFCIESWHVLFAPSNKTSLVNLRESAYNQGLKIKLEKEMKIDLDSVRITTIKAV